MPTRPPVHQPPGGTAQRPLRREAPSARGYDNAWRKLRLSKLIADPLCWWCQKKGLLVQATVVDHIRPIATHPELRMQWANLRSGCKPCHDAHTATETAAARRGTAGRRDAL